MAKRPRSARSDTVPPVARPEEWRPCYTTACNGNERTRLKPGHRLEPRRRCGEDAQTKQTPGCVGWLGNSGPPFPPPEGCHRQLNAVNCGHGHFPLWDVESNPCVRNKYLGTWTARLTYFTYIVSNFFSTLSRPSIVVCFDARSRRGVRVSGRFAVDPCTRCVSPRGKPETRVMYHCTVVSLPLGQRQQTILTRRDPGTFRSPPGSPPHLSWGCHTQIPHV